MRRYLPLCLVATLLAQVLGCGESPNRPSVLSEIPREPAKTSARYIQVPWDISLFFNIPGGAVVADATTAATSGSGAPGDNLTGTYSNTNGFGGTISGVLTGSLESGNFDGTLTTVTPSGCVAERRFSGPLTSAALNWSPGSQVNDCGGTSPLTVAVQAAAAPPTTQPPCSYSASVTASSFPAAGGTGTANVTAGAGCTWFANTTASFVTVSAGQGSGNGSVQFTVAANSSTASRTATLVVAGQSFTITQAGVPAPVCTYVLNGTGRTFDAAGGLGGVDMRAPAGCAWTAQSDAPWLTITGGAAGNGDGTISFGVAANPDPSQRVGRITAAGNTFTVTQAPACVSTVTPSLTSFPEAGGTATAAVAIPSGCAWTAASNDAWITFTGPTSGNGNGTVTFVVARNTNVARTGTMTIATRTVTISQAAATVGTVSGVVSNAAGAPIAGATVTIGTLSATTGANGAYSLPNVPLGTQTYRVSAPAYIAASGTVVVTFTTTLNATLVAQPVNLAISWSPNPTSVDPVNPSCSTAFPYCWRSTLTIVETSGTAAPLTSLTLHFYDSSGVFIRSAPAGTFAPFTVAGGSTSTVGGFVESASPAGGQVEFEFSGTDAFGRTFAFRSLRLGLNPFIVIGLASPIEPAGVSGVIRTGGVQPAASPVRRR